MTDEPTTTKPSIELDVAPPRNENCMNCKYYDYSYLNKQGSCHRFPPASHLIPTQQGAQGITMFVVVKPEEWCGEHKKAE